MNDQSRSQQDSKEQKGFGQAECGIWGSGVKGAKEAACQSKSKGFANKHAHMQHHALWYDLQQHYTGVVFESILLGKFPTTISEMPMVDSWKRTIAPRKAFEKHHVNSFWTNSIARILRYNDEQ